MPFCIAALFATLLAVPGHALAHSFGPVFNLPVPFWMYAWGSAAALLLSFLMTAYFGTRPQTASNREPQNLLRKPWLRALQRSRILSLTRLLSVGLLALCIATGVWGSSRAYSNFNMTFFWVIFALGLSYLSLIIGNVYAVLNPWQILSRWIGCLWPRYRQGLLRWDNWPNWLGDWPALAMYVGFIWIELFARNTPASLSWDLIIYSVLNLLGAGLFGSAHWFRHCEFFSVFFRLIGTLAPLQWRTQNGYLSGLYLQKPFSLPAPSTAGSLGLLIFILFMLASTAFDGLHQTLIWQRWYWVDLYHCCLKQHYGINPLAAFPKMRDTLMWWQSLWLLFVPTLYLLVYWLFMWACKLLGGSKKPVREIALAFAPSLLPIAVVYHISHYYTLLQTQGLKIIALASDPFGFGWNLFNSMHWMYRAGIPDPATVWHVQVGLIVTGHILSVYMAHLIALQQFATPRRATLSQLPMLGLMIIFTVAGLWVLSQPIKGGA